MRLNISQLRGEGQRGMVISNRKRIASQRDAIRVHSTPLHTLQEGLRQHNEIS